jgi:hypothetical protein
MKLKLMLYAFIAAQVITISAVSAHSCPMPYAKQDANEIRFGLGSIYSTISRLHELALQAAANEFSLSQRQALNNEYQALTAAITRIGDTADFADPRFFPKVRLRPRSKEWFATVVDSNFLHFTDTTLLGPDLTTAKSNAVNAARLTASSFLQIFHCDRSK